MSDSRPFAHLHCHTHYSLLDGANRIPDLVKKAKEAGMNALAITDHGNLYGALEFYTKAKEVGINPILGYEAYIAPGDRHLTVVRRGTTVVTRLTGDPPENSCRPAVDVLFRSMVPVYGGAVLAAVLTGMGHDGRRGAELLRTAGAEIVAQDEASSVVWGMPGAVVEGGLADAVLPLDSIAHHLSSKATAGLGGKSKVVIP